MIQIFKSIDGHTENQVKLKKDTVWLTQSKCPIYLRKIYLTTQKS